MEVFDDLVLADAVDHSGPVPSPLEVEPPRMNGERRQTVAE